MLKEDAKGGESNLSQMSLLAMTGKQDTICGSFQERIDANDLNKV